MTRRSTVSGYDYMLFVNNVNSSFQDLHRLVIITDGRCGTIFRTPVLPLEIIATDSTIATVQHNRRRQREKTSSDVLTLFSPLPGCQSGLCHRQMLAHRIPSEAKFQPDLDVGAALGVELLSTPEVVVREASLAAGWLLGLAECGADGGLIDTDLDSDLAGRHTCGLKAQDLLLLGRADRTAGCLADTTDRRGFARFCHRRYARRVRLRSYLTRDEALTEGEQG